ncbi:alpha/beta fold hydrolase [Verrucomicrobiaceae bacterium N1E253]|uniref:Alpha/beta fold hydrolase n=1 Tax=Oceaniferula marina TaxID=2748318 RepID=A0A851GGG9_9BACT|nr:alpha/beta fold hydrolase [Oceaniferula marina]NWK56299.1 alpha/beta fold hydrolase [Oceaniferula marina]
MRPLFQHLATTLALFILPLSAEEVELKTKTGTLKGSLESSKDMQVAVFIHPGSGPTDRNGNSASLPGKNNSLKQLAEGLKAKGIPSLRIDKRGIGASASAGPQEEKLRFEQYISDTKAWVSFLKQQGYQKIILLGHSEGALITLIAAQESQVDGYISLCGTAKSADQILLEQLRPKLKQHPALLAETESIVKTLKSGKTTTTTSPALAPIFRASVQPYLVSWMKYDPCQEIAKLKIPCLIVHGNTDIQIPVEDATRLHQHAPKSELRVIEGMNHVLKPVKGTLQQQLPSYSDPKLQIPEKLVQTITTFILNTP